MYVYIYSHTYCIRARAHTHTHTHDFTMTRMHHDSGGGEELLYQLWRLREWEEARDEWGARSEVEEFDGKRLLMVALANVALNSLHRSRGSMKAP
jgi:hypothetical protein